MKSRRTGKAWVQEYCGIINHLRSDLPADAIFHHIGSRAVPGLAAEDIIDIQATVSSLDSVDANHLARIGFSERKGLFDHTPTGWTHLGTGTDQALVQIGSQTNEPPCRIAGYFNRRYPLLCRDYLRSHPVTAAWYQVSRNG